MHHVQSSPVVSNLPVGSDRPIRALLLDDNRVDRMRIMRLCDSAELDIAFDEASTLAEFDTALSGTTYDLFLIDYRLGEGDGLIALDMIGRYPAQENARAIMIAGASQIQVAVDAMKSGCSDFLLKDHLTEARLVRTIESIMGQSALSRSSKSLAFAPEAAEFARDHSGEMRAILSAMLRQVRSLRRSGGRTPEIDGLEVSCARLWNFLELLKSAAPTPAPSAPGRLN